MLSILTRILTWYFLHFNWWLFVLTFGGLIWIILILLSIDCLLKIVDSSQFSNKVLVSFLLIISFTAIFLTYFAPELIVKSQFYLLFNEYELAVKIIDAAPGIGIQPERGIIWEIKFLPPQYKYLSQGVEKEGEVIKIADKRIFLTTRCGSYKYGCDTYTAYLYQKSDLELKIDELRGIIYNRADGMLSQTIKIKDRWYWIFIEED